LRFGFRHVESGPLVRSSYHAHEQAEATRPVETAGAYISKHSEVDGQVSLGVFPD
jgi:hypothetical protein